MPELDDAGVQLGVDHAREHPAHVVGARAAGPPPGAWTGAPGSSGSGCRARHGHLPKINTASILKICPQAATVNVMDQLAVLKALGDETRYAMYRGARHARPRPLSAQDLADRLGLHANTVRLHLERLREAGLVDVEAVHRGTVGPAPAPLLPRRRRARARLRPAGARAARRPARGLGRARRRRRRRRQPRPATPGASRPAGAPGARAACGALEAELAPARLRARGRSRRRHAEGGVPHRVPALPVPRARRGVPGAGVQPPPRALRRRRRARRRGKQSRSSRRCTTRSRAT